MPLPPKYWDYRFIPSCSVYSVMGLNLGLHASYTSTLPTEPHPPDLFFKLITITSEAATPALCFVFVVCFEIEFYYVDQASFKLALKTCTTMPNLFLLCFFEAGSLCVTQAVFNLTIPLESSSPVLKL